MSINTELSAESRYPWITYFEATKNAPPFDTLIETIDRCKKEERAPLLAVDLACGAGRDTVLLAKEGWRVIAADFESSAEQFLSERLSEVCEDNKNNVLFITSRMEHFVFLHEVQLINASYALHYCKPDQLDALMKRITSAISKGGRFCGHFLGPKDTWAKDSFMSIVDREKIEEYFQGFELDITETEEDKESKSGFKHWHVFKVLAKKV